MRIGKKDFDFTSSRATIMGILNVTPDSFSDGGRYNNLDAAKRHALQLVEDGADIIDIGAESTRPGHQQITIEEECERLLHILTTLKDLTDVPLSIDTYRAPVAKAALEAGADMINDIWGLTYDSNMAGVVAEAGCPVCVMHNRDNTDYKDFVRDYFYDIYKSIEIAKNAGIQEDQIILDPGIGFAKSFEWDSLAMKHLDALASLGYPVLLGTSRKRFIGNLLDLPVDERDEGTTASTLYGYLHGARIFRVHNVKMNRRCVDAFAQMEALHG